MKIFSIVGARPQFVKLAPLSAALKGKHEEIIVHTGQHYDYALSEQIFKDLEIRNPDIHLEVGKGSQNFQISEMILKLDKEMQAKKPDLVIVFGDTTSTLAGALTASKLNIPVLHIEAGLRSYNKTMPEEINRIATDHISSFLFAPTPTAVKILKKEGLKDFTYYTGDIMVDTMKNNLKIALNKSQVFKTLHIDKGEFNLLTLHRNYNVDDPKRLKHILTQLDKMEEAIIFPVHPRTQKMLKEVSFVSKNIRMIRPQGYLDFIVLENGSKRILTDSGGIQKEAYILKKPCVTLRSETEWVETVKEKWNLLVQPAESGMAAKIRSFNTPKIQKPVFGNNVTQKMVRIIDSIGCKKSL